MIVIVHRDCNEVILAAGTAVTFTPGCAVLQVNYNYDEYDRTIKDAIRGGRNELLLASSKPQKDWSRCASYAIVMFSHPVI